MSAWGNLIFSVFPVRNVPYGPRIHHPVFQFSPSGLNLYQESSSVFPLPRDFTERSEPSLYARLPITISKHVMIALVRFPGQV